ncbi:MAG TPA: heme-dependent oxidative N-demethylase subunit alpha family protein [Caldimonas sp.]
MTFDFSPVTAPFRMQPGLRRVAPGAAQLTPNAPGSRHLREKMAVLGSTPERALCAIPGFDEAPVLRALAIEAARIGEPAFVVDGERSGRVRFAAPFLGWALDGDALRGDGDPAIGALLAALRPGQRAAALLSLAFAEDFALLDGPSTTVPWLAVCLPSRWAPEEKVGLPFAAIHAPVADGELVRAASASLARFVTGEDRWERAVWTVTADPRLHHHPAHAGSAWPAPRTPDALDGRDDFAAAASFRSERQTFVPIAGSGQAIFTIFVESVPLADAVTSADAARRLHDAIASMTPAVLAYKRLDGVRDRLLAWLVAREADASTQR